MLYSALIEDIVKRVDANLVTEYTDRAKTLFLSVVSQLAVAEGVNNFDIFELVKTETLNLGDYSNGISEVIIFKVTPSTNYMLNNAGAIKILDIYELPNSSNGVSYTEITKSFAKDIAMSSQLGPGSDEIFYYKSGNKLIFYHPTVNFSSYTPTIEYVISPTQWSDSVEMTDKYSQKFLQRCADETVKRLYSEVTT